VFSYQLLIQLPQLMPAWMSSLHHFFSANHSFSQQNSRQGINDYRIIISVVDPDPHLYGSPGSGSDLNACFCTYVDMVYDLLPT
jgi:hypothetical protein